MAAGFAVGEDELVDVIACPVNSSGNRDGVARMSEALLAAGLAAMIPDARGDDPRYSGGEGHVQRRRRSGFVAPLRGLVWMETSPKFVICGAGRKALLPD